MIANISSSKQYCKFCLDTLLAKLTHKKLPDFPQNLDDHNVPIFVTWMLDGELRGCIGTFQH